MTDGKLDNRAELCPGCQYPYLPKTTRQGERSRSCSQRCAGSIRQEKIAAAIAARSLVCELCAAPVAGTSPNAKYCVPCRGIRRTAHYRAKDAKRRAARSATGEVITIAQLGDRDKWTCWLCNEFVNRELSGRDPWMPSFDHVTPISMGGLDSWDNLRLAHLRCNVQRGARLAHA
jgi:5-methylcytosine-specific restriction endonuclease McrA